MPRFDSDGLDIVYELLGPDDGVPTLLLHGFASDARLNWEGSRWFEALTRAGRLVVAPDQRGHGRSAKPHDERAYHEERFAADAVRLLDHLGIGEADVIGYSMGGRVGLRLAATAAGRLGRVVLGGVGTRGGLSSAEAISDRLLGTAGPGDPVADSFWDFARARDVNDLEALAACIRGLAASPPVQLDRVTVPALVVCGERDELARGGIELAAALPAGAFHELSGRDHLTAVTDRRFKEAALAFLEA